MKKTKNNDGSTLHINYVTSNSQYGIFEWYNVVSVSVIIAENTNVNVKSRLCSYDNI